MDPRTEYTTRLLRRIEGGDRDAAGELLPLLYGELRRLADIAMADERTGHTLQPTALVHEAWLRLMGGEGAPHAEGREHFLRLAARAMRNVLVDHARARSAQKRGKRVETDQLERIAGAFEERAIDVLALHEALEKLTTLDDELAKLVELRFFGGLSIPETAKALGLSTATIERDWRTARAWLRTELPDGEGRATERS